MLKTNPGEDGVRLCYEVVGQGSPILFVHEFAGDLTNWQNQIVALSDRYKCIAFNARGYPPSDVPSEPSAYSQDIAVNDIGHILDHVGVSGVHIVGLSMGAMSALHFALRNPGRVKSLVLAGCGPGADATTEREPFQQGIRAFAERLEEIGMQGVAREYAESRARIGLASKNLSAWKEFVRRFSTHNTTGALMTLRWLISVRPWLSDMVEDLRQLSVPVLIVTGDADEACIPTSLFLKQAIAIPNLSILPATGHAVNLEEPQLFNTIISAFFQRVGGKYEHNSKNNELESIKQFERTKTSTLYEY